MILTPAQIYGWMRGAGFPAHVAVTMTAIALRESAGDAAAYNGNTTTGDRSYGLVQINMRDPNVARLIYEDVLGIPLAGQPVPYNPTTESQLLDPATNAKAAFALWAGRNINLDIAWYIDRPGPYQDRYNAHLPAAQAVALASSL
jgi:hypothetical protein